MMKWLQPLLISMFIAWMSAMTDKSIVSFCKQPPVQTEWLVRFTAEEYRQDAEWPEGITQLSIHSPVHAIAIKTDLQEVQLRKQLGTMSGVVRIEKGWRDTYNSPVYPTGIALIEPASLYATEYLQQAFNIRPTQNLDALGWLVVEIPSEYSFDEFRVRCLDSGHVREVHRDEIVRGFSHQTNDPMFNSSWHIQQANDVDIDAPEGWNLLPTNSPARSIAIIEGVGFDTLNADLAGRFIDRFNAVDNSTNLYSNTTNERHGTATSGIAGAIANNAISAAGLGYNKLKIQAIRIGYNTTTAGNFTTTSVMQVAAINRAMTQSSTAAISMSIGLTTYQSAMLSALTNARSQGRSNKGIPVFASAGNSNLSTWTNYPASYSGVIAVGATTSSDARASFSNYGSGITLSAPGSSIATTDITGVNGYSTGDNTYFSGTSAACPIAATIGALMIVVNDQLTETQVKQYLAQSCEKVGGYSYANNSAYTHSTWSNDLGYGRVNMLAALQLASNTSQTVPDISLTSASVSSSSPEVGQTITINCTQLVTPSAGSTISPLVEYRYSSDVIWSANDIIIGTDVSTLGSGISSESENITFTIPAGSGTRYILVRADAQNTVAELNENNNTSSISLTILLPPSAPDVTVLNAAVSSASVVAGQIITISCTHRISSASATVYPTLQYRLSTDMTWQSTDTFIGSDVSAFSSTVQNENENITYVIPNTPGTRYILVKGDAGNAITESNESNNVFAIPVTIAAAMMADESLSEQKSTEEQQTANMRIYPNPAIDRIRIESSNFDWKNVRLFSTDGQLILASERSEPSEVEELICPQLPGGMYVLQFSDGIKTIAHRLVIE